MESSHCRFTENTMTSISASQKLGIARPRLVKKITPRSIEQPWRRPARIPAVVPSSERDQDRADRDAERDREPAS